MIKVISNKQWGLNNNGQSVSNKKGVVGVDINVVPAWRITKNVNPCIVGIIDSGIDIKHSALKKNVYTNLNEIPGNGIDDDNNGYIDDINGWDFFNNDSSVFDSSEKDSHGTSVAGIIVANDKNAKIFGVVPNAKILPLKITEDSVNVNITNVIKAIEYAQSLGVTTINCSFGTSEKSFALQNIIEITDSIFVCAAGNSGKDIAVDPIYPACFNADNIISVAAVDNTGSLDNWSNYGKKIQVAAPGSDIITTIPENKYGLFSGTSMAAPFVTGAATLIKMNDFKITNKEVVLTICKNVTFIKKLRGKVSSSGIVNVYKSLKFKSKR